MATELVALLGLVQDSWTVLGPELIPVGGETGRRAVEHVQSPGVQNGAEVLADGPHGKVLEAVAVEVAGAKPCPEEVLQLGAVTVHARTVLGPELVAARGQSRGCPVAHVHTPGRVKRPDPLVLP